MNSRERLMATLAGRPVDRPAVSFYEIGGFKIDPGDPDPFNIYNAPSWQPLLRLAEEETDLIRMRAPQTRWSHLAQQTPGQRWDEFFTRDVEVRDGSRFTRTTLRVGGRVMTELTRRDAEVDTVWTLEHLLKDVDDLKAYLELPDGVFAETWDVSDLIAEDETLGGRGIIMVDTPDPLCLAAALFDMGAYTFIAYTESALFHQLLEKFARYLHPKTRFVAEHFPGHLWRIVGPEYATEPYLPPHLFREYVLPYTGPMVAAVQVFGGYARIHCHGRLKNVLSSIAETGCLALDPIEPPPQGDVELRDVRREYGRDLALFGNLEIRDIENMPPADFEKVVARSLREGTCGEGRGFVLMPTACPYGREISPTTLANYETMVRLTKEFSG